MPRHNLNDFEEDIYNNNHNETEFDEINYGHNNDDNYNQPDNNLHENYDIRLGTNRKLTFYDEDGKPKYRLFVDPSTATIKVVDQNDHEVSTIKKALVSFHPKFTITQSGVKLATCTKRFKPIKQSKFNYQDLNGNIFKIKGNVLSHFSLTKNNQSQVATLENIGQGNYHATIESQSRDFTHVLTLLAICMCG
ncbi:AMA1 [Acrasis kona]|uniref:AMA1 n=1 Tax=Acrasis kona TaxID=1008807 RepID=A0AAW2ZPE7_9EUKA